jgi:hypothetical protein
VAILHSTQRGAAGFRSALRPPGADGDGSLTRPELEALRGQGPNLRNMDRNRDGKITKEELPPPMQQCFERMDANGNGVLEESELPRR